jgi:hypothetical protein
MPDSVHAARWVSQLSDTGWEIHLFSSNNSGGTCSELRNITVHHLFYSSKAGCDRSVCIKGIPLFSDFAVFCTTKIFERFFPSLMAARLAKLIKKLNPQVIHSLEIQHAGYLTLEAKNRSGGVFPPWIVTNWGSDIYLFGRLAAHKERIREVLTQADYYSCECQRDVCLAEANGFAGKALPVFPNAGGFDLDLAAGLRSSGMVSERRTILVKGYQTWAGRALVALRALERSADLLAGYTVAVYSATPDVEIAAELFQYATGVPVVIIPKHTAHREMLRWHGRARISIGLSISDAISTSLLEALVMGAFPVQSWTACADEWITDGVSGFLVPPEDPDVIEKALRRALTEDDLVNTAAQHNLRLAEERLDWQLLRQMTVKFYQTVAQHHKNIEQGKADETTG